jgi:Lrp/AsnC family transcriptional regulator, regulator for asnA, asnC and gidA
MRMEVNLDEIDLKIVRILMQDAKKSYAEIGDEVALSQGAVHGRVKKMEASGILKGSGVRINEHLLGWDVSAFLGIYLDKSYLYDEVARDLAKIPEIVSINYTTGLYSIFAKLVCKDTKHLRDVLHDKVQKVKGIQRTETFISLEESLNRPIPI